MANRDSDATCAALFEIVWETLSNAVGTAATAALLRRSRKRAALRAPQLEALSIRREDLEYRYSLPPGWTQRSDQARHELRVLLAELGALLIELTGPVLIRRLNSIPVLRRVGVHFEGEGP